MIILIVISAFTIAILVISTFSILATISMDDSGNGDEQ